MLRKFLNCILLSSFFFYFSGCTAFWERVKANAYPVPKSINYSLDTALKEKINRVLLLPVDNTSSIPGIEEIVNQNIFVELSRFNYFELINYSEIPESLRNKFHEKNFYHSPLWSETFQKLKEFAIANQIDGILLPEIRNYRAFRPLAVSYKHTLFLNQTGEVVWCVDDTFDMRDRPVYQKVKMEYHQNQIPENRSVLGDPLIEISMIHFLQFSLNQFYRTWNNQ